MTANPWKEKPFSFADTKINSVNNFMIPNVIETQPYIAQCLEQNIDIMLDERVTRELIFKIEQKIQQISAQLSDDDFDKVNKISDFALEPY